MSRNGSGAYSAPANGWNPAVNGTSATAADWQAIINDLVAAMTQSVSADGQTPITGSLAMGGNKLTGLAAGTATGNSLRFEQLFSQGVEVDIASAATTDIGAQNTNFLRVTGTTTITSFGTSYNGPRFLRFAGAVLLTYNSSTLLLPGAANITTAAGDVAIVVPKATAGTADGWQVVGFQRAASNRQLAQIVRTASGAVATGTTLIPFDDTIPQNTEGDQYLSRAITPLNAASLLEIDVVVVVSHSAQSTIAAALFQDSTAGALAVGAVSEVTPGFVYMICFKFTMTAGTTSATTFKVRCGAQAAGTTTFNGSAGGQLYGGVLSSSITIKECLP